VLESSLEITDLACTTREIKGRGIRQKEMEVLQICFLVFAQKFIINSDLTIARETEKVLELKEKF